ncbi:MFS transporter [Terrihabitans rhizophilus]|uniref:MFS transporter n=1 Tax=Terrihabitans rhizophilus TaxID=3092662 RepID=A0ABU4RLR5_9HYPH|nr:MFS transporter [Terrihabitans sp. PJ23]MDX6805173.1 MFS transporter [Terrihabitans sp. PJ23]
MSVFTDQRHRMLAIATAITCITVVGIGLSLSVPLLSFVLEARGVSGTMIGINTAMSGVATIMLAPFIPNIAARMGTRRLLISALVLGAAVFISFYYAGPFWLWFPLRFLFGVSLCVLFVLSEFWINAAAPEGSRGLVMGIYASCLSVGFAIGPTVLTIFPPTSMTPYVIGAVLFLLSIIPVALAGQLMPSIDHTPSNQVLLYLAAAPSAVLAAFIFGAVETGGMSFLPLYGLRNGYSEASAALLVSILALGNVLVQIPMGLISDRVDRRKLLLTLGAVGFVGAAAMPFAAQHAFALFPIVAIWGGLVAGLYTVGLAHLGAQFRGSQLAGANATFVMMYSLGLLAGPPAMGLGMDIWNPHGLPLTIALLFLLYVVVVAWRIATGRSASQKVTVENP